MNEITKKYRNMIEAFECDFRLELNEPENYNISKLLRSKNKRVLEDVKLLEDLSFCLRHEMIEIVEKKVLRKKSEIIDDFIKMDYSIKEQTKEKIILVKEKKELFINLKDKYFFKEDVSGSSKTVNLEELKLISELLEERYESEF